MELEIIVKQNKLKGYIFSEGGQLGKRRTRERAIKKCNIEVDTIKAFHFHV